MSILEVLENYREIMLESLTGELTDDVKRKMNVLEFLFDEPHEFSFSGDDGIEILKLHYKYGMSYEKIAEALNLSVSTVYRLRKKEIQRLRKFAFKEI